MGLGVGEGHAYGRLAAADAGEERRTAMVLDGRPSWVHCSSWLGYPGMLLLSCSATAPRVYRTSPGGHCT